ncbi:hypothetical protein ACQEVF_45640 [Nonomuraea polychroma]|uniref:hypothetical protein n=1 Tax=Nonomuraea polychroma TaxID=46176 RepID=UPI003D93FA7B
MGVLYARLSTTSFNEARGLDGAPVTPNQHACDVPALVAFGVEAGAAGFSFGGYAVAALTGARVDRGSDAPIRR